MADLNEENKASGVFGGVTLDNENNNTSFGNFKIVNGNNDVEASNNGKNLPVKTGFWNKFKAFWLQEIDWNREIKVELTPYQQKVEDEINEFLHQEVTWKKVHDFLFQDISFGKKNK